jgi:uncharacterized membrane protein YozB (DUF420 family)
MTLSADRVGEIRRTEDDLPKLPETTTKRGWHRQLFVLPLWAAIIYYLYYQVTPFLGKPEDELPIPAHDGFPLYYPALIVHMAAGTVALLAVCLQLWPWLRKTYPGVHRWAGRAYVFGGAIPGGTAGLTIVWFAPPNGKLGIIIATLIWMSTAVTAWVWARKKRFDLHRRFMLYSFAAVMNPVVGVYIFLTWKELGITLDFVYLIEAARWLSWIGPLMIVQWWLYHTTKRRRRVTV